MSNRISRDELLANVAKLVAKRSTCQRASVGAVLARDGRIISMGYNGAPAGIKHCEHDMAIQEPCLRTVHAEANAIAFAAKNGVSTDGTTMYCTHSPCNDCAKLIINAGIAKVMYWEAYRDPAPINLLLAVGVEVEQF